MKKYYETWFVLIGSFLVSHTLLESKWRQKVCFLVFHSVSSFPHLLLHCNLLWRYLFLSEVGEQERNWRGKSQTYCGWHDQTIKLHRAKAAVTHCLLGRSNQLTCDNPSATGKPAGSWARSTQQQHAWNLRRRTEVLSVGEESCFGNRYPF